MKLSIIVPVYRVEDLLDRCLESIVGQTFSDFEVIVVDDGSPDGSPQKCDEWARRDDRLRVIHKTNGGLSDARNRGIEAARGEFITFVDSDDFLDADTYRQVMPLADDADIVEYSFYRFYGSGKQQRVVLRQQAFSDMRHYWLASNGYEHCYAWNKVFRRRLFDDVRFPVGRVFEDVAVMPLLLRRARSIVTTTAGLYYYCTNDKGITATATGRELRMLLEAHLDVLPRWADSRYYMHVLDIQLDVTRLTRQAPQLPRRLVNPLAAGLTLRQRLKAILIDTIGINSLCKINRITQRSS